MKNRRLTGTIFSIHLEQRSTTIFCPGCGTVVKRYPAPFHWVELDPGGAISSFVECDGCGQQQVACPLMFFGEVTANELSISLYNEGLGRIPAHYGFVSKNWAQFGPLDAAISLPATLLGPYQATKLRKQLIVDCSHCHEEFARLSPGTHIVGGALEQIWLVMRAGCKKCGEDVVSPIVVDAADIAPNASDFGTYAGWPWRND